MVSSGWEVKRQTDSAVQGAGAVEEVSVMLITKCTCGDSRGSFSDVNYEVYVRGQSRKFQ